MKKSDVNEIPTEYSDTQRLNAIESGIIQLEPMGTTVPYINVTNQFGELKTTAGGQLSLRDAMDLVIADSYKNGIPW